MRHDSRATIAVVALVAVGGFAGANVRYAVALLAPGLPGTLAVNAVGSFALGALVYAAAERDALGERARRLLGTGFLSSLTTYSTFAVQTAGAPPALMVANVAANYALGFLGVAVGRALVVRYGGGA
ncbi:putative fluoride ion transport protein CrcB [Halobacterium hubeiense]|uniref:Fluoride-specific ion channel FluC n=2 Tax=Halobacterium TaxID=2239 RepID=A0A0U5D009_9EURY|nr:CrcB family protein [Halobacterium hubeiense]CQH60589.1 putative fluoride ion transport protein CrcB [Halobacterium hubeiense]